jgi:hypothetical protein
VKTAKWQITCRDEYKRPVQQRLQYGFIQTTAISFYVKCCKCPGILVKIKYCSFTRKLPSEDVDAFDLLARKMRQVRFTYVLKLIVGFRVIVVVRLSFLMDKNL